jgi:serine O-acetyltransferase
LAGGESLDNLITWRDTLGMISEDLRAESESDRLRHKVSAFLFSTSFQVLFLYRLIRFCRFHRLFGLPGACLSHIQRVVFGCYIHPSARLGHDVKFPHPVAVVIGKGVQVGDNVRIYQSVTLGSHGKPAHPGSAYPIIEEGVTIFANAVIVGGIRIGKGSIIGASSVVLKDVPSNVVVAGNPARMIKELIPEEQESQNR